MLIAVDIGNTAIHLGQFRLPIGDGLPQPSDVSLVPNAPGIFEQLEDWLPRGSANWRVATVHREAERQLAAWVAQHRPRDRYHALTHRDLPLSVEVDFPDRVGLDRLAAAVGANRLRAAGRPAVVVDSGTAITVDWISPTGAFQGGAILAGWRLSAEALSLKTDLLPRLSAPGASPPRAVGRSTEAAMMSGLYWGALGAVKELIDRQAQEQGLEPELFVSGGDGLRIAPLLGREATFVPHLVICGVAAI